MAKDESILEGTVSRKQEVDQVRRAARQFAMQYFHFTKTLYEEFGPETTKRLVQKTVFELGKDRAEQLRAKAIAEGRGTDTVEDFMSIIDLPLDGWIPEWGEDHCPYAEVWRGYIKEYPWFSELAPFYCDVIDTTTIETFTHKLSHKITQNVINKGTACLRQYFGSEKVEQGEYTYDSKE